VLPKTKSVNYIATKDSAARGPTGISGMSRYPRFLATPIPRCPAHCSFARRRHIYVSTTRRSGFPCTHTLRSNSGLPTTRCDSCMRTASRSYSRGVRPRGTPPNSILNRFSFTESADSMFKLTDHVQAGWQQILSISVHCPPQHQFRDKPKRTVVISIYSVDSSGASSTAAPDGTGTGGLAAGAAEATVGVIAGAKSG